MYLRPAIISLFLFVSLAGSVSAQNIDQVMNNLYTSISFDGEKTADYDTFKSLFIDGARLISVHDTTSYQLTPADYESLMLKRQKNGQLIAFTEKELFRKVDTYGNIAQVFSTYQTYLETPDGKDTARGINSIQLRKLNGRWKVVSTIWYEENEAHPLPDRYLPSK